ncbi:hypothetical protein SAMN05216241_103275 [Limimonas halophila]|uniref:Cytokinin riboside 5'-monophosphate phosphoribohydrolase n=1 Tax=Limimonas halophila TaxID=1082479 RepID=A0A1G7PBX0_9PROT|nr:TIGR00730 family Rossman fold protein [Limimonas halophila]SDF83721.1 hypothetical protein SAMN05216241_102508 [Limimonas halophila]SDF94673.1 hypothetical protein SAMN05216241_103275 [Limimonas halophila]
MTQGDASSCSSICVYCGSQAGLAADHLETARALGRACAANGIRVVFGGGSIGLMGALAEASRAAGGAVTGIIPDHLRARELADEAVDDLVVVDSMHERKRLMAERADGFCVLPGGIGTLDETIEILTWKQLGLHTKPVVLLDNGRFWDPLMQLFAHQRAAGFLGETEPNLFQRAGSVDEAMGILTHTPRATAATGLDRA